MLRFLLAVMLALRMCASTPIYNILFLSEYTSYASSMDRWFFELFEAAQQRNNCVAYLWGPNFPGYNTNGTLRENLKGFAWRSFDLIIVMYPFVQHSPGLKREHFPHGVVVATIDHELHPGYFVTHTVNFFTHTVQSDIVFLTYHGHVEQRFFNFFGSPNALLAWLPHGVLPRHFVSSAWSANRPIKFLLFGAISGTYPTRQKVRTLRLCCHVSSSTVIISSHRAVCTVEVDYARHSVSWPSWILQGRVGRVSSGKAQRFSSRT